MPKILTNIHKQWLVRIMEPFTLHKGIMYHMGRNNRFRRCVTRYEAWKILHESHEGFGGGNFATNIITKNILDARYWWSKLFHCLLHSSLFECSLLSIVVASKVCYSVPIFYTYVSETHKWSSRSCKEDCHGRDSSCNLIPIKLGVWKRSTLYP